MRRERAAGVFLLGAYARRLSVGLHTVAAAITRVMLPRTRLAATACLIGKTFDSEQCNALARGAETTADRAAATLVASCGDNRRSLADILSCKRRLTCQQFLLSEASARRWRARPLASGRRGRHTYDAPRLLSSSVGASIGRPERAEAAKRRLESARNRAESTSRLPPP